MNNLRQIRFAIPQYRAAYGRPLRDIVDKRGRPLLSWRVQLLPFLEEENLFNSFHLDEPWDSLHNLQFLRKMPKVYRCPGLQTEGITTYLAVRSKADPGEGAVREAATAPTTAVVVLEVDEPFAVHWTKPDDFEFDADNPMRGVGRWHGSDASGDRGSLALFADGTVRVLSPDADPELLRAVLGGRGGGVRFDGPWYEALSNPRVGPLMAAWLTIAALAVGGAAAVVARIVRGMAVSPGEVLWLTVGVALFVHAVVVLLCYKDHRLNAPGQDTHLQTLFWFPPAALPVLVSVFGAVQFHAARSWMCLFVGAAALLGIDALDAAAPHQHRPLEESFITAFPPVVTSVIGIVACTLTLTAARTPSYPERWFAHWCGIAVFLLPSVWFAVCCARGLVPLREPFMRILD